MRRAWHARVSARIASRGVLGIMKAGVEVEREKAKERKRKREDIC